MTETMITDPSLYTGPERRRDVQRRRRVSEMDLDELRRTILMDDLTGIGNRRAFNERDVTPGEVIILIDVDSLKYVNDAFGHPAGDALLGVVGDFLRHLARFDRHTTAYRIAGDEFALVVRPMDPEPERRWIEFWDGLDQIARYQASWEDAAGGVWYLSGVSVTYGIGDCLDSADKALRTEKALRQEHGMRAARGERPEGLKVWKASGGAGDE